MSHNNAWCFHQFDAISAHSDGLAIYLNPRMTWLVGTRHRYNAVRRLALSDTRVFRRLSDAVRHIDELVGFRIAFLFVARAVDGADGIDE